MAAGLVALLPVALLLGPPERPQDWPGLPPDCWQESRNVHGQPPWRDLDVDLRIERAAVSEPERKLRSPNGGYWVAWTSGRPQSRVTVYAEKDHQLELVFAEVAGLEEPTWVNEKLLFLRVWWGRRAATDLILDVESERFVYREALVDGRLAWQQYREGCKVHGGCRCVQRAAPSRRPQ